MSKNRIPFSHVSPIVHRGAPSAGRRFEKTLANFTAFLELVSRVDAKEDGRVFGRHSAGGGFDEAIMNQLIERTHLSQWSDEGLLALISTMLRYAPLAEAAALARVIENDLAWARFYELHGHFEGDGGAEADCGVCAKELTDATRRRDEFMSLVAQLDDEDRAELLGKMRQRVGGAS